MNFGFKPKAADTAELDVTSFMNLMVVLVPVLLITLSFAQVTVLDIHLPQLTGGSAAGQEAQSQLVVKVQPDGYRVYYPDDQLIQEIPLIDAAPSDEEASEVVTEEHDYQQLSLVMREVKKQLPEHTSVLLLSEGGTRYQTLVTTMDAVRSYETVVAASVVEIELFPEISLGDLK